MLKPLYLISTCAGYEKPLLRLLESMDSVDAERIMVVRGSSFDYTALISWSEQPPALAVSHVFLLHDTMELGPGAERLIGSADPNMEATAAHECGQSNLILFRSDYLMKHRDDILAMRNCTKMQAIEFEGELFKRAERKALFPRHGCEIRGEESVYGGVTRRIEYYPSIDTTKLKANWGQDMVNLVVSP